MFPSLYFVKGIITYGRTLIISSPLSGEEVINASVAGGVHGREVRARDDDLVP